jgi:hypothetical protein
MANALNIDLRGKVVVLGAKYFSPDYQDLKWRLHLVTGGFGASPATSGRALFCTALADGEEARYGGNMVERLATGEEIAAHNEAGVEIPQDT